jgi:hypothetical protein
LAERLALGVDSLLVGDFKAIAWGNFLLQIEVEAECIHKFGNQRIDDTCGDG